jgi:hypothetical protein
MGAVSLICPGLMPHGLGTPATFTFVTAVKMMEDAHKLS